MRSLSYAAFLPVMTLHIEAVPIGRRMRGALRAVAFLFSFLLLLSAWTSVRSEESGGTAVLISDSIRPYIEAVEGFSESMSSEVVEFTLYSKKKSLPPKVTDSSWELVLAVGPNAAGLLIELPPSIPRMYTMVLNPRDALPKGMDVPGVSLNIPADLQLIVISELLPKVKRVGVFYDKRFNADHIAQLLDAASTLGLEVIPVSVTSKRELRDSLTGRLPNLDAVLMVPDPTVISESVVVFVIKESLKSRVPVIGYNRFFQEEGALFSFIIDYREVGRKTAELAQRLLRGEHVGSEPPPIQVRINRNLARKFGFTLGELPPAVKEDAS